jgi:hypothetical protein
MDAPTFYYSPSNTMNFKKIALLGVATTLAVTETVFIPTPAHAITGEEAVQV